MQNQAMDSFHPAQLIRGGLCNISRRADQFIHWIQPPANMWMDPFSSRVESKCSNAQPAGEEIANQRSRVGAKKVPVEARFSHRNYATILHDQLILFLAMEMPHCVSHFVKLFIFFFLCFSCAKCVKWQNRKYK